MSATQFTLTVRPQDFLDARAKLMADMDRRYAYCCVLAHVAGRETGKGWTVTYYGATEYRPAPNYGFDIYSHDGHFLASIFDQWFDLPEPPAHPPIGDNFTVTFTKAESP